MKLGDLRKNLSLKKKDAAARSGDVLIESTTAAQIAEMKKRLASRTRDLEEAQSRINSLKNQTTNTSPAIRETYFFPIPVF